MYSQVNLFADFEYLPQPTLPGIPCAIRRGVLVSQIYVFVDQI